MRVPVAQVVVHSTSKQEVRGSIPDPRYQWKFSKYFNLRLWWFGTHLKIFVYFFIFIGPIANENKKIQIFFFGSIKKLKTTSCQQNVT